MFSFPQIRSRLMEKSFSIDRFHGNMGSRPFIYAVQPIHGFDVIPIKTIERQTTVRSHVIENELHPSCSKSINCSRRYNGVYSPTECSSTLIISVASFCSIEHCMVIKLNQI